MLSFLVLVSVAVVVVGYITSISAGVGSGFSVDIDSMIPKFFFTHKTFLAKLAFVFLFGVRSVHNPNMLLEILNPLIALGTRLLLMSPPVVPKLNGSEEEFTNRTFLVRLSMQTIVVIL